ncbi:MAG: transcriptional regulator [Spirochaetales bacterium]|nr:transcriptional regulator [Spirochaetales bacterium]
MIQYDIIFVSCQDFFLGGRNLMRIDGAKLRHYREEAGLTQGNVGASAGLAKETISRIERGRIENLKAATVRRIEQSLSLPHGALALPRLGAIITPSDPRVFLTLEAHELSEIAEVLPRSDRQTLLDFARFLHARLEKPEG